jgi:type I restriction enzyme S subunit
MKSAKLTDLFDYLPKSKIKAGEGLNAGKYPFYTSSESLSKYLNEFQHGPGCLVFGTGGKASVHLTTNHFSTSTDCITIRPKRGSGINAGYVYQYLKGNMHILENGFKGVGLKHISKAYLSDIQIPYPEEVKDQIRIAHLLDKVEGVMAQRKQHLQQLDNLLKSVFLKMFGDPVRNQKGWVYVGLGGYITHLTSGGRGWAKYYSESGKRFIRSLDVQMNRIGEEDIAYVNPPSNAEADRTRVQSGDVLLTITGSKIGRVCFVPKNFEEAYISQHVSIIRTKGINPVFLSYYLSAEHSGQIQIKKQQYGQAKPGLNLTQIKNFQVPLVDINTQNQFAMIFERVEGLKSHYQKNLYDLESLYAALSQQAFKGELDLSKLPLPDSKSLTSDDVEISVDPNQTLKSSEKVIKKLNTFNNQHAVLLKALNSMPALKVINSPIFKAARELTEQAALWRTPLDQFKNMRSVAKATETIAAASNIPRVNNAALLAQQIAKAIPKVDMDWLKEQQAIIKGATGPFSEMRQAIAALKLSDLEGRFTGPDYKIPALHAAMPSKTSSRLTKTFKQDDEESEPRYIFTRDDILKVLSGDKPLSVVNLMSELAKLEAITSQGYERIKSLIFSLLAEKQIQQQYNDEENTIAFRTCV